MFCESLNCIQNLNIRVYCSKLKYLILALNNLHIRVNEENLELGIINLVDLFLPTPTYCSSTSFKASNLLTRFCLIMYSAMQFLIPDSPAEFSVSVLYFRFFVLTVGSRLIYVEHY